MKNNAIRETVQLLVNGITGEDACFFDLPSFDNSIVGIDHFGRVIYNYEKMVEEFAKENECSYGEASEFIDVNTIGTLPYVSDKFIIFYPLIVEEGE